jgi:hypothetical protein
LQLQLECFRVALSTVAHTLRLGALLYSISERHYQSIHLFAQGLGGRQGSLEISQAGGTALIAFLRTAHVGHVVAMGDLPIVLPLVGTAAAIVIAVSTTQSILDTTGRFRTRTKRTKFFFL